MICQYCDEEILPGERADVIGSDFHRECLFRTGAGSVGHIRKRCSCYGGTEEDPPGMTKREAAKAALAEWKLRHPFPEQQHHAAEN